MTEVDETPYEEAIRLTAHLHELLDTQQTATGALISARLLPVVKQIEAALERWAGLE